MTFTELVRKNIKFVILFPLVIAGLVLAVSLFQTELYKSSVSLMVVQQQTEDINAQTSVKSAEQMADILSRVVESAAFRSTVLADREVKLILPEQPWKQDKEWREIVKTKNITDTGILVIDVFQPSTAEATKLAGVVERNLISRAYDYLGVSPAAVHITQLNPPAPTNDKPATPNLVLNTVVAFLFGLIAALSLLLLFPGWKVFSKKVKLGQPTGGMIYSEKFVENFSHPMAAPYNFETEQEDLSYEPQASNVVAAPGDPGDDTKMSFVARAEQAHRLKM